MPDQTPNDTGPDPARVYERAKPEMESGMGRLDNDKSTPTDDPDRMKQAVKNEQPLRQLNAEEITDERDVGVPGEAPAQRVQERGTPAADQPDHSMMDEDPTDPDLAPQRIKDHRQKRHPRKEGKGGTP